MSPPPLTEGHIDLDETAIGSRREAKCFRKVSPPRS